MILFSFITGKRSSWRWVHASNWINSCVYSIHDMSWKSRIRLVMHEALSIIATKKLLYYYENWLPDNILLWLYSNFSNYKARFTMPEENKADQDKNMFYSFNLGPIHFISINTEYYYYMDQPWNFQDCVIRQYIWLYYDLKVECTVIFHEQNRLWYSSIYFVYYMWYYICIWFLLLLGSK